jgi:hypothetical protein
MFTLEQVLNSGFARSWHEAVALVQEVASQLGDGLAVPDPQDLLLDENGTLSFGFGSEGGENPVAGLARLLGALIKGLEAPPGLVELVRQNAKPSPAHGSLGSFTKALSFYERSNRANDLRAIASRIGTSRSETNPELEFERLREKLAAKDNDAAKDRHANMRDQWTIESGSRWARIVVVLIIVLIVTTLVVVRLGRRGERAPAGAVAPPTAETAERPRPDRTGKPGAREAPANAREIPVAPETTSVPRRSSTEVRETAAAGPLTSTKGVPLAKALPTSEPADIDRATAVPRVTPAPVESPPAGTDIRTRVVEGIEPAAGLPGTLPAPDPGSAVPPRVFERESAALEQVLNRYEQAYDRLDAAAAIDIWPSVDSRALARAFARLKTQNLDFGYCTFAVSENDATAQCAGVLRYARRIGDTAPKTEHRQWTIEFARTGTGWRIVRMTAH